MVGGGPAGKATISRRNHKTNGPLEGEPNCCATRLATADADSKTIVTLAIVFLLSR